jgi:hypothetical protein
LTVGDGSDDFPFVISFSSKALLSVLLRANESLLPVVFHMDSTFKCNENEFPVTLLGLVMRTGNIIYYPSVSSLIEHVMFTFA